MRFSSERTPQQMEEDSDLFNIHSADNVFRLSAEMEKYEQAHEFRQLRDERTQEFAAKYGYYPEQGGNHGL